MNDIITFKTAEFGIIKVTEINGTPCYRLCDVCNILNISDVPYLFVSEIYSIAIKNADGEYIYEDFISENDLYRLIDYSKSSDGKSFKQWIKLKVHPKTLIESAVNKNIKSLIEELLPILDLEEKNKLIGFLEGLKLSLSLRDENESDQ